MKKDDVDRSTLYSFDDLFQLLHFQLLFSTSTFSATDPKYCLLFVDLFTSKVYVYPMKSRKSILNKMQIFYKDVENKRKAQKMRLQIGQEFKQRKVFDLNKKYNVDMFSTAVREGKAFAAEQKLRELKKRISKIKAIEKNSSKKISPYQIITKSVENMYSLPTAKYKQVPNDVESKTLISEADRERFDFTRLLRISKEKAQQERYNRKIYSRKKLKLRSPLDLGKKVHILAGRIKKKDSPGLFYKNSTDNKSFFNRQDKFLIINRQKIDGKYFYWLKNTGSNEKLKNRLQREEIFAILENFN